MLIRLDKIPFLSQGGPELGGVYVKGILPGGPADVSRKIMKG